MKTSILTIATIFTLALGTATSSFASANNNNEEASTVLTNISKINKIELHGNVELYVSDGATDQVKVYNKYYSESALVQSQNGTLRISSYSDKKLVVWVTANDLQTIIANDNSQVRSFGNLAKLDLEVTLNNTATADLKINAYKASIVVNDRAKANISGTVNDYSLKQDQSATVNHSQLATVNGNKTTISLPANVKVSELATL
ncbi:GIN domain-containing protein [Mucilaginibacter phyllosphaerae]|uniref:Putative auto-transporter adhesin head GIN domain-containing protein n=1 Tax=Mucilaginibacter phyllosphaerae TaxID=1812349 RepID=A0A4Y8A888_9SPHI|nr:DUF2807 domain-containing protein [Mucilaginibacter phyllosphaerae]MBB3970589.1 hypothetical protein [Mucilaginibacter phyllosphaerae]TEW64596.1 hypothetical protein E2R65_16400 [Mucilaginibacter phyllosphaerae]GGH19716.1 hypothetical protein GCM10007352_31240 [Mucilaginibacter phyllosphaerae]